MRKECRGDGEWEFRWDDVVKACKDKMTIAMSIYTSTLSPLYLLSGETTRAQKDDFTNFRHVTMKIALFVIVFFVFRSCKIVGAM